MNQKNKSHQQEMLYLLEKWEHSGISLRAFSKTVVISYEKLRYWRKKFKKNFPGHPGGSSEFIPIDIPNKKEEHSYLQISYPNHVKLTCPSDLGIDKLKSLINLF